MYNQLFYRILFSILSLPIFIYAIIKYLISGNNSEDLQQNLAVEKIAHALQQKYLYLKEHKTKQQLFKEAQHIYNRRNRYDDEQVTNDFTSFYKQLLFNNHLIFKVILAFPLFIVLSFYLNPMVRYIF
ncbi:hypothetical protein BUY96_12960, partial [Staphylococcus gallinarum]